MEFVKKGEKEFIDKRGKISNYELTEPINLIGYIESVKGSMRANHYHPVQEQKVLLVKGQFISIYKSLLENYLSSDTIVKPRQVWWKIRPHMDYGTIEFRICDTQVLTKLLSS